MDGPGHLPVDTASAPRPRSILKKRDSHDCGSHHSKCTITDGKSASTQDGEKPRGAQWDEMNILATYHPAGKDYGHMKIDDPPTPYHEYHQELDGDDDMDGSASQSSIKVSGAGSLRERKASFSDTTPEVLDSNVLAEKLAEPYKPKSSKVLSSDSDEESSITEEERAKKREFKNKRKQHYNEFQVCVPPIIYVICVPLILYVICVPPILYVICAPPIIYGVCTPPIIYVIRVPPIICNMYH